MKQEVYELDLFTILYIEFNFKIMTKFSQIDSVHSVATRVDYFNPALHWNVMWLSSETLGAYESFLGKFRTILQRDELQNWIIQNWHHRAHLCPITNMVKAWNNIYFYRSIKWSGFSNPHGYLSKKDDNWTVASETEYTWEQVPEIVMKERTKEYDWWYEVMWCFDDRVFGKLQKRAEELQKAWARVEMIAKSGILEEVVYNWEIVSVRELKQRWVIPNKSELNLRQFERLTRSRFRIKDFCDFSLEEKQKALKETFALLDKENEELWLWTQYFGHTFISNPNREKNIHTYVMETSKNLGKNLAIFFSKWYTMWYMNSGNITLWAGEIVDLDSLRWLHEIYKSENIEWWIPVKHYENTWLPMEMAKDMRDVTFAFNMLIKSLQNLLNMRPCRKDFSQAFLESFKANYKPERWLQHYYKKENLFQTLEFYVHETIKNWIWQSFVK